MQSEVLAEWSRQAMGPPAAPAAFKGILSKRGRGMGGSGGAAVHHLLRGTGLKNEGWSSIIYKDKSQNPSDFRPYRIAAKCQRQERKMEINLKEH